MRTACETACMYKANGIGSENNESSFGGGVLHCYHHRTNVVHCVNGMTGEIFSASDVVSTRRFAN